MRILIDLDGVCADFYGRLLDMYNNDFDDDLTRSEITTWALAPAFRKATREQIRSYMSVPGFWSELQPIEGAVETLYGLHNDGHDLVVVSAAPGDSVIAGKEKFQWVHKHIEFLPHDNIILASRKELVRGDMLFDDGPHNTEVFPGMTCMMDAPYNREGTSDFRVKTWAEFKRLIGSINASTM
jgi:5'(3')-deoxyribonucleotidase